jgi:hypothetical protein
LDIIDSIADSRFGRIDFGLLSFDPLKYLPNDVHIFIERGSRLAKLHLASRRHYSADETWSFALVIVDHAKKHIGITELTAGWSILRLGKNSRLPPIVEAA